jgi:hypothetical protein
LDGNGQFAFETSQFAQGVYFYHVTINYDSGGTNSQPIGKFRVLR